METVYFSETLVYTYESTRRHNTEEQYRHLYHCEDLRCHSQESPAESESKLFYMLGSASDQSLSPVAV
jgi:hypothetical protein